MLRGSFWSIRPIMFILLRSWEIRPFRTRAASAWTSIKPSTSTGRRCSTICLEELFLCSVSDTKTTEITFDEQIFPFRMLELKLIDQTDRDGMKMLRCFLACKSWAQFMISDGLCMVYISRLKTVWFVNFFGSQKTALSKECGSRSGQAHDALSELLVWCQTEKPVYDHVSVQVVTWSLCPLVSFG